MRCKTTWARRLGRAKICGWLMLMLAWSGMAADQIESFDVLGEGWKVRWYVRLAGTNGNYVPNLQPFNRLLEQPMLYLEFADMGFTTNNTPTTYARRSHATMLVTRPYPDQNINEVVSLGGGLVTFITSVDERISQRSSNLLAYARAGAFVLTNSSGVVTSSTIAAFGLTGTNSSAAPYAKSKVKMNWVPFQRLTNDCEIPFVGSGHVPYRWPIRSPIACGAVSTRDETGTVVSNVVSTMRIRPELGEYLPTAELQAPITPSSFTQGEYLTTTLWARPWIGDDASTASITFTNLCDRTGAYCGLVSVVDLGGSDANGRPLNLTSPTNIASGQYYASINGACAMGAASNNVMNGHNDVGGLLVYVRAGVTNFAGASAAVGSVPKSWVKILPYPGHSVSLTNRSGSGDISDKVWIEGLTLAVDIASITPFSAIDHLVFKDVTWNSASSAPIQNCTNVYVWGGRVMKYVAGFGPFASQPTHFRLVRNCDMSGDLRGCLFMNWVGNYALTTNSMRLWSDTATLAQGEEVPCLYNNYFPSFVYAGDCIDVGGNFGLTNGAIIVNNLLTYNAANAAPNLMFVGTKEGKGSYDVDLMFNTLEGKRVGFAYCTDSNLVSPRSGWQGRGNLIAVKGVKSHTWTDPGASGLLTNNWMVMYGVHWSDGARTDEGVDQAAGTIWNNFEGLSMYWNTNLTTNLVGFPQYISPNYHRGDGQNTTGGGNYDYLPNSPLHGVVETPCWPYDLAGRPRYKGAPPGALVGGNPRQGFF